MRKMLTNQIKRRVSLLSVVAATLISPAAAMAEETAGEDSEQGRSRRGEEIIVTGSRSLSSPDMPTATPVQLLSGDELAHRRQGGLGETLAGLPGVHLDNFGGGASRPVIRGQTVPRIEILSDGANLFDVSSVSPDHAIATEPLLLDAIEVLRGPGATRYGGNAVNGVINLIDSKVPKALPEGGLSGATEVRYGTGDEEKTVAGRVTAGIGPLAIHAEGARHVAENYNVPDAYGSDKLRDSFAESTSYAFGASLVTSKGYIGASYTRQNSEYGLPGHSHEGGVCHTHGSDLHCEAHDIYDDPFGSPDSHTAYIKLRSERVDLRADYDDLLPGFSHVRLRGSYTDYAHDEIDGDLLFANYTNQVYDARVELTHKPLLGFTGTLGAQYTHGTFTGLNRSDPKESKAAPEYVTEAIGVFLSERRSFGRLDLEASARKDWISITVPFNMYAAQNQAYWDLQKSRGEERYNYYIDLNKTRWVTRYPEIKSEPFSIALSGTWRFDQGYSIALALSRSERMPGVREWYAEGNSLATNSLEGGLVAANRLSSSFPVQRDVLETAKSINLTLRKSSGATQFEIGLFHQDIDDYVFARLVEQETLGSGAKFNYLVYTAADATFTGIDGQISHQFNPSSRVTVFGDYVRAKMESGEDRNLPRIPPGRLGARYEGNWGPLSADLEYYRTFAQNRVATYRTVLGATIGEAPTDGYNMLNATISYRLDVGLGKSVEFYARGTNLTNELAFSHTSFVKNQSPLRGRSIAFGMRHQF